MHVLKHVEHIRFGDLKHPAWHIFEVLWLHQIRTDAGFLWDAKGLLMEESFEVCEEKKLVFKLRRPVL